MTGGDCVTAVRTPRERILDEHRSGARDVTKPLAVPVQRLIVRPAGPHAILVEFGTAQDVHAYYLEALRRRQVGELETGLDIVPGARTILFDGLANGQRFADDLLGWQPRHDQDQLGREIEIPTVYDGPDLADVAGIWQLSTKQAVEAHVAMTHVVAFHGFVPGFAYIEGIPEQLKVGRRARPRVRVPVGSVAVADQFTGVYPRASPGGWQLIGRTNLRLWDEHADPAAYLLPGDRVRFVPVTG
jgi:KipI family sensor histidine kinase inhibitor